MGKMTTCKTCGEEIAKSAKTCPKCGAKQKRKHPILGALVILLGIGMIVAALGGGDEPSKVGETQQEQKQEEQTEFYVGDIVSLNDVEVTFISCEETKGANFMEPEAGNVFLLCEFEINNKSDKDIAVSSLLSFEAYADDYTTNMSLSATVSSNKSQLDGTVAAGKKMSGVIGYEVSKDWNTFEIRFTPDFWARKDITFIASK